MVVDFTTSFRTLQSKKMRYLTLILLFVCSYAFGISGSHLNDSLVAYWSCNTNTTANDTIGSLDGTLGTYATVVTGKIGKGYNFDGQNLSRITMTDASGLQMYNKSFTWGAWINITTLPADFAGLFGGEDDAFYGGITSTGHLKAGRNNHSEASQSTFTLTTGVWYYVTFRFSFSGNNFRYGRDNTFESQSYAYDFLTGAGTNIFGQRYTNIDKFQGVMDEVGLWSGYKSDALIDTLYNGVDGTGSEGYVYPWSTIAGTPPPPISGGGAKVRINNVEQNVVLKNRKFNYLVSGATTVPPPLADTIQYFWAEDFESATSADVNSLAGMEAFFGEYRGDIHYDLQSIESVSGNKMLRSEIKSYYEAPTDCFSSLAIFFPLGDTTSDAWCDADMIVPVDFDPFGIGNDGSVSPSHKISTGFEGTNNWGLTMTDSVNKSGWGSWAHLVNTGDRYAGGASRGFTYAYTQGIWNFTTHTDLGWYGGYAVGDSGYFTMDTGIKFHVTLHYRVGRPGYHEGYLEVFRNGTLAARLTGIKQRSVSQGNDFGKIENGALSFFLGGESSTMLHGLPVYGSRRHNTMYFDNLVWYTYRPGAVNYRRAVYKTGTNTGGVFTGGPTAPMISPPVSSLRPDLLLTDESYTTPDTIFDVGNGKHYIYMPPSMSGYITKTVTAPAGKTIEYRFLTAEFGFPPDYADQDAWVKAYVGIGSGKTGMIQYGRTSRPPWPALTAPGTGWHSVASRYATFEIHEGTRGGDTRGFAIEIRAVP
jgi:hypothetical protein